MTWRVTSVHIFSCWVQHPLVATWATYRSSLRVGVSRGLHGPAKSAISSPRKKSKYTRICSSNTAGVRRKPDCHHCKSAHAPQMATVREGVMGPPRTGHKAQGTIELIHDGIRSARPGAESAESRDAGVERQLEGRTDRRGGWRWGCSREEFELIHELAHCTRRRGGRLASRGRCRLGFTGTPSRATRCHRSPAPVHRRWDFGRDTASGRDERIVKDHCINSDPNAPTSR